MMGFIRWSYVAPRLAALALVVVAVQLGLPPLVRWSITTSGQAATGARVDVGRVECSLLGSKIELHDLAVADPDKPFRNLFEADHAVFELEPASLAKKRIVVRRGSIEGLQFSTRRASSGELGEDDAFQPPAVLVRLAESAADRGEEWLGAYWSNLRTRLLEDLRREFRSIALAEELSRRWPAAYQQYEVRVQDLLKRGRDTEAKIRAARENPLRNLAELRQATQQIDQLNRDLSQLVEELTGLAPQIERDREAVWAAMKDDKQKLQAGFSVDAVNGRAVSDYLLQEEVAGRVGTIMTWIERVRSILPASHEMPEPERQRGVNVLFAGLKRQPDYLIRSLELHGKGTRHGQGFELTGTILGLSSQPKFYGRPTIVRVASRGAVELDLEASIDRTGDVPVDKFAIRCPAVARPAVVLGRPESFSLSLGEGRDEITADLSLQGSDLTGTLCVKMHMQNLQVTAAGTPAAAGFAKSLNATLAEVRSIETTLHVAGSLDEPAMRMESTLGSQVLAAVQAAAARELAARQQELEQALLQHVQRNLQEADRLVEQQRRQLEQRLNEQQATLIRLASDTFGLGDRPSIRLGSTAAAAERRAASHAPTFQR